MEITEKQLHAVDFESLQEVLPVKSRHTNAIIWVSKSGNRDIGFARIGWAIRQAYLFIEHFRIIKWLWRQSPPLQFDPYVDAPFSQIFSRVSHRTCAYTDTPSDPSADTANSNAHLWTGLTLLTFDFITQPIIISEEVIIAHFKIIFGQQGL